MGGVQHTTPEDPNALAFDIKKGHARVPPLSFLTGEKGDTRPDQLNEAVSGRLDGKGAAAEPRKARVQE
jgi:hypothetical protein